MILIIELLRYLAICHPKLITKQFSKKIAIKVIVLIWAISFLTAWPWAHLTIVKTKLSWKYHENISQVNYLVLNGVVLESSAWCSVPYDKQNLKSFYMTITIVIFYFFFALTIVTVLFLKIIFSLSRVRTFSSGNRSELWVIFFLLQNCYCYEHCNPRNFPRGKRSLIRMLVAIVVVFFLCWSPFHAQRLLFMWITLYGAWNDQLMNVHYVLFITSGLL